MIMKGVRTTRKLQRKRRGGTPNNIRESRRQSGIRKKIAWGPIIEETREFDRSPTEQYIADADLQQKIDYYTQKIDTAESSNMSLQTELDGMKTGLATLNNKNKKLLEEYTRNRDENNKDAQHTRQAKAQMSYFEDRIIEIESKIAANNYKINMYEQYIAHPNSISRLLQTRRRHESSQQPRKNTRMTLSEKKKYIASHNKKLEEQRHYTIG
jgi:chromosome segregation ATPase